jgi:quercetin dioxygenase-like cupin family protein
MDQLKRGELFAVPCNDLPWTPSTFAPGLSVKDIAVAGGLEMQIVRMEAGAQIPLHTHELPEFIYVLEGDLVVAGQTLGAGWASIAAPGSEHSGVCSINGCTFVLVDRPV